MGQANHGAHTQQDDIMTAKNTTKLDINTVAKGGAAIVDWSMQGSRITPDALRLTLIAHGYDPTIVPDIDQNAAVRSVSNGWKQGRGDSRYSSRVLSKSVDEIVISVRVDIKRGTKYPAVQIATVTWDKVNKQWGGISFENPGDQSMHMPAIKSMKSKCDIARLNHDHQFIRPTLIQLPLRMMGAVPFIRSTGGAMVVPAQNFDELRRLQGFVNAIGDSYMGVVKADITDQSTVASMQRSVTNNLALEVKQVREDLKGWRDRGTRLPTASIGDRLNRFAGIRDKANLYAEALGMVVKDLLTDIGDAEQDARDLLDIAMGVTPAPAPVAATDASAIV